MSCPNCDNGPYRANSNAAEIISIEEYGRRERLSRWLSKTIDHDRKVRRVLSIVGAFVGYACVGIASFTFLIWMITYGLFKLGNHLRNYFQIGLAADTPATLVDWMIGLDVMLALPFGHAIGRAVIYQLSKIFESTRK